MPNYALYCLNGSRLARCERFAAASDDAAIAESRRREQREAAMLWCETRRVKVFAHADAQAGTTHI